MIAPNAASHSPLHHGNGNLVAGSAGGRRMVLPNTSADGAVTNVGDVLSGAALTLDEPVLKVLLDCAAVAENATEGLRTRAGRRRCTWRARPWPGATP